MGWCTSKTSTGIDHSLIIFVAHTFSGTLVVEGMVISLD